MKAFLTHPLTLLAVGIMLMVGPRLIRGGMTY